MDGGFGSRGCYKAVLSILDTQELLMTRPASQACLCVSGKPSGSEAASRRQGRKSHIETAARARALGVGTVINVAVRTL